MRSNFIQLISCLTHKIDLVGYNFKQFAASGPIYNYDYFFIIRNIIYRYHIETDEEDSTLMSCVVSNLCNVYCVGGHMTFASIINCVYHMTSSVLPSCQP